MLVSGGQSKKNCGLASPSRKAPTPERYRPQSLHWNGDRTYKKWKVLDISGYTVVIGKSYLDIFGGFLKWQYIIINWKTYGLGYIPIFWETSIFSGRLKVCLISRLASSFLCNLFRCVIFPKVFLRTKRFVRKVVLRL